MPKEIKLGFTEPDVVVSLGKYSYALRPFTKDIEDQLKPLSDAVSALQFDEDADAVVRVEKMALQLDVMLLSGIEDQPKPSEVIVAEYKAGRTTRGDIEELCGELVLQTRPT